MVRLWAPAYEPNLPSDGIPMQIVELLILNLVLLVGLGIGLWGLNLITRDPSFIDGWWPLGMMVAAWTSFGFTGGGSDPHRLALTGLCTAWGLRLGLHLLWRWRQHGADQRYSTMMATATAERSWSYAKASFLLVFALQPPMQAVVCLPVQLGQLATPGAFGALAWAGVALAALGIFFETVGDWQLMRFKANPANSGKVMDKGLWRYTRHPNYFGDACVWWGLWLIAADTGWVGAASLPGPILITLLLTRWSGVPTVEGSMRRKRPDYEAYVARTSGFIPLPPKRA
jgi:steroid 5-alpha reductase family enzyme